MLMPSFLQLSLRFETTEVLVVSPRWAVAGWPPICTVSGRISGVFALGDLAFHIDSVRHVLGSLIAALPSQFCPLCRCHCGKHAESARATQATFSTQSRFTTDVDDRTALTNCFGYCVVVVGVGLFWEEHFWICLGTQGL